MELEADQILSAVVGVCAALFGAGAAWWVGVLASRWTRTLDMHREFNSREMSNSRSAAYTFIKHNWGTPMSKMYENPELDEAMLPLWDIMRFYQRLAILVKHGQVVRRVVPEMFGEVFMWWHIVYFERELGESGWESDKDLAYLYDWIRRKTPKSKFRAAKSRIESEYKELQQQFGTQLTSSSRSPNPRLHADETLDGPASSSPRR